MKIAKEMLSTDGKYKSVIILRDDGLYEVDWHYWNESGYWSSSSTTSSSHHLTDTFDHAVKISLEQLESLPGKELDGMTVNERLGVKGLDREFDDAINTGDKQRAIDTLIKLRLTEAQAAQTIEAVFQNQKFSGYKKKERN